MIKSPYDITSQYILNYLSLLQFYICLCEYVINIYVSH